jgi:hypothetical protein
VNIDCGVPPTAWLLVAAAAAAGVTAGVVAGGDTGGGVAVVPTPTQFSGNPASASR